MFDIFCRAGNFRYVDFLLLTSVIPIIIGTAYLYLEKEFLITFRPNPLRNPFLQENGIHPVPIAHSGYR